MIQQQQLIITNQFNLPDTVALVFFFSFFPHCLYSSVGAIIVIIKKIQPEL